MLSKDYFQTIIDQVSCTSCGKCCPKGCPHLVEDLCNIHPSQHRINVKYAPCELKPMELVLYFGILCPPALEIVKKHTGIEISASTINPRFCDEKQLEAALSLECVPSGLLKL